MPSRFLYLIMRNLPKLNPTVRRKLQRQSLSIIFWEVLGFSANNEKNELFEDIGG